MWAIDPQGRDKFAPKRLDWQHLCRVPLDIAIHTKYISCGPQTGPRSGVGKVSGYRCVSDCRSRGHDLIPARSHTFVEIDHEIISTVILLPSPDSFKMGCCQLQAEVCAQITG